ncbi:hypothetical protein BB561_004731 [Smittium simulii]|uniref:Protein Abitram n=1 Tax=Smittium simulii TaxID=133385 RepID=A0A2T9YEH9_9FUNG|nr:hypothetical protein BB561_004731 [Smittium simulii]
MDDKPTYEVEKYKDLNSDFQKNPDHFLNKLYSIYLFDPKITDDSDSSTDLSFSSNSQMILSSRNDLAVILLSETHTLISDIKSGQDKIKSLTFPEELLSNNVSGKRKRNALKLNYNSKISTIVMESGITYDILAGVTGFLLEINKSLMENPNEKLIDKNGYFVIMKVWINRGSDDYDFSKPYYKAVCFDENKNL